MTITTTEPRHIDDTLLDVRHRMNQSILTQQIDEFIGVISSEGFVQFINDVAELPTYSERRAAMAERANLETLQQYSVPTPEGLRLTTREFEIPEDGKLAASPLVQIRPGTDPRMGACVSVGWIVCVSYGN